jgi:hypothetical protein
MPSASATGAADSAGSPRSRGRLPGDNPWPTTSRSAACTTGNLATIPSLARRHERQRSLSPRCSRPNETSCTCANCEDRRTRKSRATRASVPRWRRSALAAEVLLAAATRATDGGCLRPRTHGSPPHTWLARGEPGRSPHGGDVSSRKCAWAVAIGTLSSTCQATTWTLATLRPCFVIDARANVAWSARPERR